MKRYLKRRFAGLRVGLIAVLCLAGDDLRMFAADRLPDEALPVTVQDEEPALLDETMSDAPIAPENAYPAVSSPAKTLPAPVKESITDEMEPEAPPSSEVPDLRSLDSNREIIQERYANGAVKTERGVRQDAAGNYVLDGDWRSFDPKGVLIAEGQYLNNQRHGTWRRFFRGDDAELFKTSPYSEFKGPFISQTVFQQGKLNGAWIITDSKQRKISEIEFTNGQRNGHARWWHSTGRMAHELHFAAGQIHGEARVWDVNGSMIRKETYIQGRRVGSITDNYDAGQKKQQAEYLFAPMVTKTSDDWWNAKLAEFVEAGKEERHGHFAAWHPNGMKQRQGEYAHGLPVGKMTWWYANGQKSVEGSYSNGKPVGQWNWWHENGQKSIAGAFQDGAPEGEWLWWKQDGKLTQKVDLSKAKDVARSPQSLGVPAVDGFTPRANPKSR